MAPFPWRFTDRHGDDRIEDANGNYIIEIVRGERSGGTSDDLERLARAISELADLVPVVDAALDLFETVKRPVGLAMVMSAAQAFANEWGAYNLREEPEASCPELLVSPIDTWCSTCRASPCRRPGQHRR